MTECLDSLVQQEAQLVSVFQALLNHVLRRYLNRFVFIYLDDILIFPKSLSLHESHIRLVLQHLLDNLSVVRKFHVDSVSFLSYIVEKGQIWAAPAKIQTINDCLTPTTIDIVSDCGPQFTSSIWKVLHCPGTPG